MSTKTDLLSALESAQSAVSTLSDQINALPDDPLPAPNAPANFAVGQTYGTNPLTIPLSWDVVSGGTAELDVIGAPGNPHGPQEWTPVNLYTVPNGCGYVLQNPAGQQLVFRVRQSYGGVFSGYATLNFNADDYLT